MNWLKYLALLAALGALVVAFPILWEIGLVGAIGGAIWIFVWPKENAASGHGDDQQAEAGEGRPRQ